MILSVALSFRMLPLCYLCKNMTAQCFAGQVATELPLRKHNFEWLMDVVIYLWDCMMQVAS